MNPELQNLAWTGLKAKSGRGQPQSKTCRITDGLLKTRERSGVRLSSAALYLQTH